MISCPWLPPSPLYGCHDERPPAGHEDAPGCGVRTRPGRLLDPSAPVQGGDGCGRTVAPGTLGWQAEAGTRAWSGPLHRQSN